MRNMPVDQEIFNNGESDVHEDLLDPNAIAPERQYLQSDTDEDSDCEIIERSRPEIPPLTPPALDDIAEDVDPDNEPKKVETLFIAPMILRQL